MKSKKPVFAALIIVLLIILGTTAVIAQRTKEPAANLEVVDLSQIKEDVIRDLFNDNGRRIGPDQRLANIARDHEGGFGGFYFHETDKSIVYVYMQDITKTASAEAAFRAAYDGDREVTQIIPVQGDYSFDKLVEWFYTLNRALIANDIHPSTGSVRELENRIRIGLQEAAQIDDALLIMKKLGIPEGAVFFEEDRMKLLADIDSVRAK